jgi:hypothetical protein
MFDTAGSPSPQAAFRVNLNAAGSTSAPQVGGYISNVFTAADYGTWIHWAVAWDTSMAGTKCLAVYKNGINLNINQPYYAAAININTSNANGFTVGYDDNFNQAPLSGGNRSFSGDLAEFYANFSQDAFTSTPCIGGGSIPPSMLAGLIAGTGSSVKPVNMKTTCSAVTGLAPTICLRGNAGNFANNSGTGGAFVNQGIVNDSEYGPPTIPNDHVARLKWRYIIGVVNGTTLSYGDYATVPGDLLVLAVTKMQSSAGAATATVPGFTQLSCGGGTSSNDMMQCIFYRIATSAGEAPPAITFTGAVRSAQASILVYGNATGIGAAGSWVVIDPSSATSAAIPGITPTQSNSTIVTTAFTYDSRSSPYSFTGNTYSLKYDGSLYAKGSSMFPETYIGDFINSGLTAVPATTFHTTGADNLSGLTFEILHN